MHFMQWGTRVAVAAVLLGALPGLVPTSIGQAARRDSGNPFADASFFVDPNSPAKRQVGVWLRTRPIDAAMLARIAGEPHADWFGAWSGDIRASVGKRVSEIRRRGSLPVLVSYNVPLLHCTWAGAPSAAAYLSWIRSFVAGIGSRKAVVILEPDALASLDCLSRHDRTQRLSLLAAAVRLFTAHPQTAVYVDAGHARWHSAWVMRRRLAAVGVARARGFSLNVSNFGWTAREVAYGKAIAAGLPGTRFVVDTSRNGLGPPLDGSWCNPDGRALGLRPTTVTGDKLVDAFLWIKPPGESDGLCRGGPSAGSWWLDYAFWLALRAPY